MAERGDLDAIIQLLLRDSLASPPEEPGLTEARIKAFEAIAAHPDNELIVATFGGEVVSTTQLTFIPFKASGVRESVVAGWHR